MKHIVTITKQDFLEGNYFNGRKCPLALALKRTFPEATNILVSVHKFQFKDPKLGFVERDFIACEIESCDYEPKLFTSYASPIENIILELSVSLSPVDLTFNFITA